MGTGTKRSDVVMVKLFWIGMLYGAAPIWQPASRIDVSQALRQWFKSELGRELLDAEDRLLGHILPDLFGYHALQLGQIVPCHLLHASRIRHRIVADKQLLTVEGLSSLPALPEQLPLTANSMDVVVLQHLLDVTVNPHAVLREAARVLIPEGHGTCATIHC